VQAILCSGSVICLIVDQQLASGRLWPVGVDPLTANNLALRFCSIRPTNNEPIVIHSCRDASLSPDFEEFIVPLKRRVVAYCIERALKNHREMLNRATDHAPNQVTRVGEVKVEKYSTTETVRELTSTTLDWPDVVRVLKRHRTILRTGHNAEKD